MRRRLLVLPFVLAACGLHPPPVLGSVVVHGVPIVFEVMRGSPHLAEARVQSLPCRVRVEAGVLLASNRWNVAETFAHEVSHCLDAHVLGWAHGGFTRGDCPAEVDELSRAYRCAPEELFARAYASAYVRACGPSLQPLGFDGASCAAPDPRSVRP